jgi:phosphonate metabolism-associated iron-containing alcohol dehydrogenase
VGATEVHLTQDHATPSFSFDWRMPVAIHFGAGAIESIAARLGARCAVVLAYPGAEALGLRRAFERALGSRLLHWHACADGLSTVSRIRDDAQAAWPLLERDRNAVLIGLGGGSVLDTAKVVRLRSLDGRFDSILEPIRGRAPWPELARATLWLAPTTAGTGSEVTRWATLWDTEAEPAQKRSLDEPFAFADAAFVDPELSSSCPPPLTRDCGLDALAHALEAIWNRHSSPITDSLAVSAARRIVAALPAALDEPGKRKHRWSLALGALEAGLASSQTRTALAHALSYDLTLKDGLSHGHACAVWLGTAWRLARGTDARVDTLLEQVFDTPEGSDALTQWLGRLGFDERRELALVPDVDERVAEALRSVRGRNFIAAAAPVPA